MKINSAALVRRRPSEPAGPGFRVDRFEFATFPAKIPLVDLVVQIAKEPNDPESVGGRVIIRDPTGQPVVDSAGRSFRITQGDGVFEAFMRFEPVPVPAAGPYSVEAVIGNVAIHLGFEAVVASPAAQDGGRGSPRVLTWPSTIDGEPFEYVASSIPTSETASKGLPARTWAYTFRRPGGKPERWHQLVGPFETDRDVSDAAVSDSHRRMMEKTPELEMWTGRQEGDFPSDPIGPLYVATVPPRGRDRVGIWINPIELQPDKPPGAEIRNLVMFSQGPRTAIIPELIVGHPQPFTYEGHCYVIELVSVTPVKPPPGHAYAFPSCVFNLQDLGPVG